MFYDGSFYSNKLIRMGQHCRTRVCCCAFCVFLCIYMCVHLYQWLLLVAHCVKNFPLMWSKYMMFVRHLGGDPPVRVIIVIRRQGAVLCRPELSPAVSIANNLPASSTSQGIGYNIQLARLSNGRNGTMRCVWCLWIRARFERLMKRNCKMPYAMPQQTNTVVLRPKHKQADQAARITYITNKTTKSPPFHDKII